VANDKTPLRQNLIPTKQLDSDQTFSHETCLGREGPTTKLLCAKTRFRPARSAAGQSETTHGPRITPNEIISPNGEREARYAAGQSKTKHRNTGPELTPNEIIPPSGERESRNATGQSKTSTRAQNNTERNHFTKRGTRGA
jgi:hypothetical protein